MDEMGVTAGECAGTGDFCWTGRRKPIPVDVDRVGPLRLAGVKGPWGSRAAETNQNGCLLGGGRT